MIAVYENPPDTFSLECVACGFCAAWMVGASPRELYADVKSMLTTTKTKFDVERLMCFLRHFRDYDLPIPGAWVVDHLFRLEAYADLRWVLTNMSDFFDWNELVKFASVTLMVPVYMCAMKDTRVSLDCHITIRTFVELARIKIDRFKNVVVDSWHQSFVDQFWDPLFL